MAVPVEKTLIANGSTRRLVITAGQTMTVFVACKDPDSASAEALDLTGGVLIFCAKAILGFSGYPNGDALISRQADFISAEDGTASFSFAIGDTLELLGEYAYDVVFIASNGDRTPLIPISRLRVNAAVGLPDEDVTVLPSQEPLAKGDPGEDGEDGIDGIDGQDGQDGDPGITTFTARTVGNTTQTQTIYTLPVNSAGQIRFWVGAVSNSFSAVRGITGYVLIRRVGSGDGSVNASDASENIGSSELDGVSVSINNTLTAGALSFTVQGKATHTIDWTIKILPVISTQT